MNTEIIIHTPAHYQENETLVERMRRHHKAALLDRYANGGDGEVRLIQVKVAS